MTVGVYWFYQKSKDRAVYIGSSVNVEQRLKDHVRKLNNRTHCNPKFIAFWNKYDHADIHYGIIEETSKDKLVEREQFWMDAMPIWPKCNISLIAGNPMLGRKLSEESRKKISIGNINAKKNGVSPETSAKLSLSSRGRVATQETREKISLAGIGRPSPMKGKKHSPESIEKMRVAATGKKLSEETKFKIGSSSRGIIRGPMPEFQRLLLIASLKGKKKKPRTAEHQRKLVESNKRNKELRKLGIIK